MNYKRTYTAFIADRRAREADLIASGTYCEKHHVTPRSLGGGDEPENLIALTAEDHVRAHVLLAGCDARLWTAVTYLLGRRKRDKRPATRRELRAYSLARKGTSAYRKANPIMRDETAKQNWLASMEKVKEQRIKKLKETMSDPEWRANQSAKAKEAWSDPAKKQNLIDSMNTPEMKESRSGENNVMADPEVRARHREALAKPEYGAKISRANKGKKRTEEFCATNSKNKTDWTEHTFVHVSGEVFAGIRKDFISYSKISKGSVSELISGKKACVKDWSLNSAVS